MGLKSPISRDKMMILFEIICEYLSRFEGKSALPVFSLCDYIEFA